MDKNKICSTPTTTTDNCANNKSLICYIFERIAHYFAFFFDNPVFVIATISLILAIIQLQNPSIFIKATYSLFFIFFLIEAVKKYHQTKYYRKIRTSINDKKK